MDPLKAGDPSQVGGYRLLARLGEGGMGQVFLGETPGHLKVAVKLIRPELAGQPNFRLRFTREVAAAREVGGVHAVVVLDADPDGDPPWMATAYFPGPSLAAKVNEQGPLDPADVSDLGEALAEGLSAVHACGIIHRDLKPSNIIMAEDGPRIIDFGIAKRASTMTITPAGAPMGTVQYMSPEHLGVGDVTAASDVFSLGAVLTFAATGHGPFDAPENPAVIGRILTQPPALGSLMPPLRDIICACLAKNPDERPSLNELLAYFSETESCLVLPSEGYAGTFARPFAPVLADEPAAESALGRAPAIGAMRYEPIISPRASGGGAPVASDETADRRGSSADDDLPWVRVRDLPPDVRRRFWRLRLVIMVVIGAVFAVLTRSWEIALVAALLVGIVDTIRRSRSAARYVIGNSHPGARTATNSQLARMRREGYRSLRAWPIPKGSESVDHLVIGPTGVYAIDSEKWDPGLPISIWNGKKLDHGPKSHVERLERAVREAAQVSEFLSQALGSEIAVRPALAIYGPKVPYDIATIRTVDVFSGPALRKYLRRRSRMRSVAWITSAEAQAIHDTAARML